MKNKLRNSLLLITFALAGFYFFNISEENIETSELQADVTVKTKKKTQEERALYAEEREKHEFDMQKSPFTGEIPIEEKEKEYLNALVAKQRAETNRTTSSTYTSRGPSNLGGRTRALAIDLSDATSNTILAGGISSGLFRTTNGGTSWTKVSSNGEIHNVSALAQDPRPGFQNIWYYGTGEWSGNSASLGSAYRGQGVWRSTNGGVSWTQIASTSSVFESFDSFFDYINALEVSPLNGDLLVAATGKIYRLPGGTGSPVIELEEPAGSTGWTDVVINGSGVVYAAIEGINSVPAISPENGVWTSPTGNGSWTQIATNGAPAAWSSAGRIVLASAPSNDNIIYAMYMNGTSGIDADLWRYNAGTTTWTNYSSKLPDEPGGDLVGNDPFTGQGGYDLVVSVKPDDANFVVIGGTNAYKIADITNAFTTQFNRIGGYNSNANYLLYPNHHPDIHALVFDPNNNDVMFSGTDGGVHRTPDITLGSIAWTNLNNNYQTYQYYHVAVDPQTGSDIVIGGAQDNGTTVGGTGFGQPNATTMTSIFGGDGVAVTLARRNGGTELEAFLGSQLGNLYRYNTASGYFYVEPAGSSSQFVTYFYLDPVNDNALYYAGQSSLYRTTNAENVTNAINASNWQNLGALPVSQNLRSFATSPGVYNASTSYLLIGGQNGGVFRLNDPQNAASAASAVNITPAGATTTTSPATSIVSGLAIHPTNPDIAIAVYANYGINSIFITNNLTTSATWTLVEQNLNAHSIRSAAIAEVGGQTIYFVGTARGLYSNADPENNNWDIEGQNEMGLAVISSLAYRPADNKLIIGTHGNGMWETTVENTLSVNSYNEIESKISIYPNPAQSEINFKSNSFDFSTNANYSIIDISGKVVANGVISDKKVDVSRLNSGLYFVNINANGIKQTLKFIKK